MPSGKAQKAQKAQKAKSATTAKGGALDQRIVDRTVGLAAEVGWEGVRLRRVAEDLGITLPELRSRYRDLDAIADAWFRRALDAMLAIREGGETKGDVGFADLPARERVYLVMVRWFEAQRDERAVVGQMLSAKLYPSHPHHWVPAIFHLSRLIQWVRDAACLDAPGQRRQVEEVGLTLLFLVTLRVWLRDQTEDLATTRRFLRRRLKEADRLLANLPRPRKRPATETA
jgi:AcrR family transcriptional regulator